MIYLCRRTRNRKLFCYTRHMLEKIKSYFKNYFKKRSLFSIISDAVFVVLVVLLLIPSTRKEVSAFFIKLTSLPPSTLDKEEQYTIDPKTLQWNLTGLDGKKVTFGQMLDKPVLLNLWATWCPPCVAELPGLLELSQEYGDKANFLLVTDEPVEKVKAFLKKHGYSQRNFYLSRGVPPDFATRSIPASYIVSENKKVVLKKKGAARWNTGKVKRLLDKLNR